MNILTVQEITLRDWNELFFASVIALFRSRTDLLSESHDAVCGFRSLSLAFGEFRGSNLKQCSRVPGLQLKWITLLHNASRDLELGDEEQREEFCELRQSLMRQEIFLRFQVPYIFEAFREEILREPSEYSTQTLRAAIIAAAADDKTLLILAELSRELAYGTSPEKRTALQSNWGKIVGGIRAKVEKSSLSGLHKALFPLST